MESQRADMTETGTAIGECEYSSESKFMSETSVKCFLRWIILYVFITIVTSMRRFNLNFFLCARIYRSFVLTILSMRLHFSSFAWSLNMKFK